MVNLRLRFPEERCNRDFTDTMAGERDSGTIAPPTYHFWKGDLNKDRAAAHHDTLEVPDGEVILLNRLLEGQGVLQVPARLDGGSMSTMDLTAVPFQLSRFSVWCEFRRHVADWRARARSRHELMMLSDHDLADMGLSRMRPVNEGDKPFWRA